MSDPNLQFVASSEAELIEQLHDRAMADMHGTNGAIFRVCKAAMPALLTAVRAERQRGTHEAEIAIALCHIVVSLHMSALLTLTGSHALLAPILPDLIGLTRERYQSSFATILKQAMEETH